MNLYGREGNRQIRPVIAGSFLVGAAIFVLSFVVMDFVWTHFVATDLQKLAME
jgi:hypothetical protein